MVYKFSGHETFHCRPIWLKKGFDFAKSGMLFNDENAVIELGVGKNMVASIKFWLRAFGFYNLHENELEGLACDILNDDGFDPYLENEATLFLLHYLLIKNMEVNKMHTEKDLKKVDKTSFQLGMINCFVEMIACKVKKLALSPPLQPHEYHQIKYFSERIVEGFKIKSYLEKSLMVTDLQSSDFTQGKWSIIYYADDKILETYFLLKKEQQTLLDQNNYTREARHRISIEFMELLSYPNEIIEKKLSKMEPTSPFMLI